ANLARAKTQEQKDSAELELKFATIIRDRINKFERRSTSGDSLFKSLIRDELTGIHILFNAADGLIPKMFIMGPLDDQMSRAYKEGHDEEVRKLEKKMRNTSSKEEKFKLKEDLVNLKDKQYIKYYNTYPGDSGIPGIFGSVFESVGDITNDILGDPIPRVFGADPVTDMTWKDFLLDMQIFGIGQNDINRVLRQFEKIEEEKWKAEQEAIKDKEIRDKEKPSVLSVPMIPNL
ncbi:MAG: hypothetical protein ACW991_10555, partial [Candidatus Hodarchaeales archaeon]